MGNTDIAEHEKQHDVLNLVYPWLPADFSFDRTCAICDQADDNDRVVYSFTLNGQRMRVGRCARDGLMYLAPQPRGTYLAALYNHPSYFLGTDDMFGLLVEDEKSRRIARIRIEEVRKWAPSADSFLEIGSAYGHTLIEAARNGFTQVTGVEFSEDAVGNCSGRGLDVHLITSATSLPEEVLQRNYGVIALYSVLEHLSEPRAVLELLAGLLDDDGLIVIRVPRMSEAGPWISLLDHLWHFAEDTLSLLVKRAGLRTLDVFPSGDFVSVDGTVIMPSMTLMVKK